MAESEPQILLKADNLGVKAGTRWLIRHLDLEISAGEIVTLIGPNGGGKSTTVKALLLLVAIAEGHLTRKKRLSIGYVPQKLTIDITLPLTVRRFMQLPGGLASDQINQALVRTGVEALVDQPVQTLSGGEFQRVQLARAIAKRPELLVLDEPVQGVDFQGELALYELIGEIRDELGCGILLVSHDLHIVMAKTDRVICLNGHVCCQGTPGRVREDDAYKDLFGHDRSDVIGVYHHHHDHSHDIHDHCIPNSDTPNSDTPNSDTEGNTDAG